MNPIKGNHHIFSAKKDDVIITVESISSRLRDSVRLDQSDVETNAEIFWSSSPVSIPQGNNSFLRHRLLRSFYLEKENNDVSNDTQVSASSLPQRSAGFVPRIDFINMATLASDQTETGPVVNLNRFISMLDDYVSADQLTSVEDCVEGGRELSSLSRASTQSNACERLQKFMASSPDTNRMRINTSEDIFSEGFDTLHLAEGSKKKILGRGSFGTTYLVEIDDCSAIKECGNHKIFAFKELIRTPMKGGEIETLLEELHACQKTTGIPNAVKVFGIYKINGKAGLLSEYIRGEDSNTFFSNARQALFCGVIDQKEFFAIVKHSLSDLLLCLAALETRTLTHNDISPDNLRFSFDTHKLIAMDFGLLRDYESPVSPGKIPFMPPDVVPRDAKTDNKIDPFFAGQVLHSWIYGKPFNWADRKSEELMHGLYQSSINAKYFVSGEIHFDPDHIKTQGENEAGIYQKRNIAIPAKLVGMLKVLLSGDSGARHSALSSITSDPYFQEPATGRGTIGRIVEKITKFSQDTPAILSMEEGVSFSNTSLDDFSFLADGS